MTSCRKLTLEEQIKFEALGTQSEKEAFLKRLFSMESGSTVAQPSGFLSEEEILDGKGVKAKERLAQAEASGDIDLMKIPNEKLSANREEAEKYLNSLAELSYLADITKPLHRAYAYAWRMGDIASYVDALPSEFEVSQEFSDAKFNESDSPMWNLQIQPVIDAFAVIDNGRDLGLVRKDIQVVGELASLAQQNIAQGWLGQLRHAKHLSGIKQPVWISKKDWNHSLFLLGQQIGKDDILADIGDILAREEVQEIVKGYSKSDQQSMVEYFQGIRYLLREMWAQQNAVREKLGRPLIPEIDNYLPWLYEVNVWGNLFGFHLKPEFIMETASQPDFIKPDAPFNARAMSRKLGMGAYEKVEDVDRLIEDYISVATRDMFFTPVIENTKVHVKTLLEMGQVVPARYIEQWALERYAGVPSFWTKAFHDYVPGFITRPLAALNRSLTRAVFALNFQWNLVVQPSSMALTVLRYGTVNTIKGLDALFSPKARKVVNMSYSHILKSRQQGSLVFQDVGTVVSQAHRMRRGKLDTATDIMNFFTRWVELLVTDVSIRAGYYDGISKGLKGHELTQYAADAGAKTQSMYDMTHVPGWIKTPLFQYFIRFQTFAFEALTRVREMANISFLPKAGAYQTVAANSIEGQSLIRTRLSRFLQFMAAMWVFNMLGEIAIDRKPWEYSSFLPAASLMMISSQPYKTWNYPIPFRYGIEVWQGFDGLIQYGNWKPLTIWATRWHLPAGIAASRTLEGIIAVIDEGQVKDVTGEVMYKMEPEEYIKAVIMGNWQTETGREYRERMFEDADKTTDAVLKELEEEEKKLGTVIEGKDYRLGNYLTASRGVLLHGEEERQNKIEELLGEPSIEWTGETKWLVMEEGSGFPLLTKYAVYCSESLWEEYNKIPSDAHLEYRKNNPAVDASLYFWEQSKTLRSDEALKMVEQLFRQFGIGDNPRAHWTGLEEIPDEVKLLPE